MTPMTLKVAVEAHVTGIGEELTSCAGEPVRLVQKADPILCWQIVQPPINIPMKFLIQLDSVVEVLSFHGCFNHIAEEGPTRPAYVANEVKFSYQRQDGLLCGQSMAHNVLK